MTPHVKFVPVIAMSLSLLIGSSTQAQITVKNGASFRVKGQLATNSSISNTGITNLEDAEVFLNGSTQQMSTTGAVKVKDLTIAQGGTKTLIGDWEVSGTLSLINGLVKIGDDAKLRYSGTSRVEGNNGAFIDGFFYQTSGGQRFFPIGTRGTYAPAIIENAPTTEVGMRVLPGASDLPITLPPNVIGAYTDHYWEVSGAANSVVSLSINGAESFLAASIPTVLQTGAGGGSATSLSGSYADNFVSSSDNALQPLLLIGKIAEFQLVIHDLITPYNTNVNDRLVIENLDKVEHNTVKLLDRWGVVAAEWKDYNDNVEYDFTKLSPGNYVCLVQFKYPGDNNTSTAKGMVTVIKSN
jgi:hypothetical protein